MELNSIEDKKPRRKGPGRPKGAKNKKNDASNDANKLPEGAVQDVGVQTDTEAFKAVVDQSRETLHSEAQKPVKVKGRGPGRPKKDEGPPSVAPTPGKPDESSVKPPLDITPYLIVPLQALSKVPANNTGIPELMLSADEAAACARSLNEVLNAFAPEGQLNPKTAAVLGAFSTFGSIGFMKYQLYLEKKPPKEDFSKEEKEPEIEKNKNTISAESHFRKYND